MGEPMSFSRREFLAGSGALVAGVVSPARQVQTYHSFKPGEPWLDTAGKPIHAHGGSLIEVEGRYYWYGENKEFTTGKTDVWTWGVRCYASEDLYNWTDLGLIIPPNTQDPESPLFPSAHLDRPHIIYNATTKQFVCWFKLVQGAHQTHTVMVSSAITGPYTIVHSRVMPVGMNAGDFDLCVSPDEGKAYMYFERVHSELICADLTDDYTGFTGYYSTHFPHPSPPLVREAPAYFRRQGAHYLATSGTTGYFPNPSEIAVADSYHGPFRVLGDLHPTDGSHTSFNSQISCIFKHPRKRDLYIAIADRWMGPQDSPEFASGETSRTVSSAYTKYFRLMREANGRLDLGKLFTAPSPAFTREEILALQDQAQVNTSQARYVWLPIRFSEGRAKIEWREQWRTDEFETA